MSPSLRPVWMPSLPATAARQRCSSACVESLAHGPGVPFDLQRLAPLHRGPGVVRDDGDTRREIARRTSPAGGAAMGTIARTPRTLLRRGVVEGFDAAVEIWAARDDREQHARHLCVDAVARAAADDVGAVGDLRVALPMMRKSFGSLSSNGPAGSGSAAARAASSP